MLSGRLEEIENLMSSAEFWEDKDEAQKILKEYQGLKEKVSQEVALLRGDCILNIFTGAGGDDAEDWTRMLLEMYIALAKKEGCGVEMLDEARNNFGGYRNVSIQISGKGIYGKLKNEIGVHRLIRNSPFNSKGLRQTSFSYVEVLPVLPQNIEVIVRPEDLEIQTTKSSGPGGQNVNKRETAIRLTHVPTGIKISVQTERSQERNKEIAINMLKSKLYLLEEEKLAKEREGYVGDFKKGTDIEWGSQIRTYTLHPYKLVKDHRTNVETSDVDGVLLRGDLEIFYRVTRIYRHV
jgi:peptide chain release factor 2